MEFYTSELQASVGVTARMRVTAAVTGAFVHGAQVPIIVKALDPIFWGESFTDGR